MPEAGVNELNVVSRMLIRWFAGCFSLLRCLYHAPYVRIKLKSLLLLVCCAISLSWWPAWTCCCCRAFLHKWNTLLGEEEPYHNPGAWIASMSPWRLVALSLQKFVRNCPFLHKPWEIHSWVSSGPSFWSLPFQMFPKPVGTSNLSMQL